MRVIAVLCLLLPINIYSQNFYAVAKASRRGLQIERVITVSRVHARMAQRVVAKRAPIHKPKMTTDSHRAVITAKVRQNKCHPTRMVGGYNYLRAVNKKFKSSPQWKGVTESGMYNGVHHIVTQTVIDAIAKEVDIKDTKEMKANAPAAYSALHGNPQYGDLFHDHATLLDIYHAKGIHGIVTEFYERLNEKNKELGLPLYEEDVIELSLMEAELWAKHWGIRWK